MIKLIISTCCLLFSSFFLSAQNDIDFRMGAIGGFGLSNVNRFGESGNGLRLGMHLGIYLEKDIDETFSFRPEVHILSIKGTSSGGYRATYFDFPLMGQVKLDEQFSLLAGVQPSLLIHARTDDDGTLTDEIRTLDFGLVGGGWYQFDEKWGAGARFSHGILRTGADGNERHYNVNFQLSIGYRIF